MWMVGYVKTSANCRESSRFCFTRSWSQPLYWVKSLLKIWPLFWREIYIWVFASLFWQENISEYLLRCFWREIHIWVVAPLFWRENIHLSISSVFVGNIHFEFMLRCCGGKYTLILSIYSAVLAEKIYIWVFTPLLWRALYNCEFVPVFGRELYIWGFFISIVLAGNTM